MSKNMLGLVFALFWTAGVSLVWYWVFFKGGATEIGKDIIEYHKRIGTYHKSYEIMIQPLAIKIYSSILLLAGMFAIYCAVKDLAQ